MQITTSILKFLWLKLRSIPEDLGLKANGNVPHRTENHQIRTAILVRYAIANTPYNSIDYLAVSPRSGAMRSSNVGIPVEFICC